MNPTTNIITVDSESTRSAQSTEKLPTAIQSSSSTLKAGSPMLVNRLIQAQTAVTAIRPQVTNCALRSPMKRPNRPATRAPRAGEKTRMVCSMPAPQPRIRLMSSTSMLPRLRK